MIKNLLITITLLLSVVIQHGQAEDIVTVSEEEKANFMLVVRTSFGSNKEKEGLIPSGIQTFQDSKGNNHTMDMAHFEYLGDTHIRFVFDSEFTMANVTTKQFETLKLTPEEAVKLAISNIHKSYGKPTVLKIEGGNLYKVVGESSDLDSSYFLDREFWLGIEDHFEEKIIVAVPSRELLLFTLESDEKTKQLLQENVSKVYSEAGKQGVSSSLFAFHNGNWSVYQAPSSKE